MTPIADMVAQMLAAGVPHEMILLAIRTAETHAVRGHSADKIDVSAERRRAADRDRKRLVRGHSAENPQKSADTLSLTKEVEEKPIKEPKKERSPRKLSADIPADWRPPDRAREIATELQVSVVDVEGRFRDYLKSTGRRYVDYDAAFCNFVRNSPKFNGGQNGTRPRGGRPNSPANDFFAGIAQVAANLGGDGDVAGGAEPDIPRGRLEIDG